MADFERLGVCPEIIRVLEEEGWQLPSGVQDEAIPLILGGGDVCAAAETGTGKTGAFGVPCVQSVHEVLQAAAASAAAAAGSSSAGGSSPASPHNGGGGVAPVSVPGSIPASAFSLDPALKDHTVLVHASGLEASCTEDRWRGVKSRVDVLGGVYAFEVEVLPGSNLVRVGCGTAGCSTELGRDAASFAYGGTGKSSWNGVFSDFGPAFGVGDVVSCIIDWAAGAVRFAKNGREIPGGLRIPPALAGAGLRPALCGRRFAARINFGPALAHPGLAPPVAALSPAHSELGRASALASAARKTLCLVLEPTKDLAQQTFSCMRGFAKYLENPPVRIALFAGGINEREQRAALRDGVDIAVGTVQRVLGHVQSGALDLSAVKFLVLDEADELLKFDDRGEITKLKRRILSSQSSGARCQTLFFSATLHDPAVRLAVSQLTLSPTWVDLKGKPTIPDTVHCLVYEVDPRAAAPAFRGVRPEIAPAPDGVHARDGANAAEALRLSARVKDWKPRAAVAAADTLGMRSCLIFCRTNLDCDNFEAYLTQLGGGKKFVAGAETGVENPYSCVVVAGMRDVNEREAALAHFKAGAVRFLVATDVAARGIDIKELPFVIMMTLPEDPNQFFHRVGRVGRVDKMGLAVILAATVPEKVWYHRCRNRGQGCTNTKDIAEGGCTVWFDEPKYLAAVEAAVGAPLPRADPTHFSKELCLSVYGRAKDVKPDAALEQQMRSLDATVAKLQATEKEAQRLYCALLAGIALSDASLVGA